MPATPISVTRTGVGSSGGGGGGVGAGVTGYHIITPVAGVATIDLAVLGAGTYCSAFRLVLDATAVSIPAPIITGSSIVAGMKFWLYLYQDSTGDRAIPVFDHAATGDFGDEVASQQIDGTPSTMSVYQLTYHGTRWLLDVQSVPSGLAIT